MGEVIAWVQANWVQLVAALWLLEQLLRVISAWTPTKLDDNIVDFLSNILKKFFPKGQ